MAERSPYKKQFADPRKIFYIVLSGTLIVVALSTFYYFVISKPKLDEKKVYIEGLKQENKRLELMKIKGESDQSRQKEKVVSNTKKESEIQEPIRSNNIEMEGNAPTIKEQGGDALPPTMGKKNERESIPAEETGKEKISIYEERRLKGLEQFEKEVIQYAKKADQMDIEYRRYKDSCMNQSTYVYNYGRSWFSVWDGYTYINNESLPECKKIWSDFVRLTEEIKAGMIYSMEMARKAGVYPGQVRKVREKYYLDWEGGNVLKFL